MPISPQCHPSSEGRICCIGVIPWCPWNGNMCLRALTRRSGTQKCAWRTFKREANTATKSAIYEICKWCFRFVLYNLHVSSAISRDVVTTGGSCSRRRGQSSQRWSGAEVRLLLDHLENDIGTYKAPWLRMKKWLKMPFASLPTEGLWITDGTSMYRTMRWRKFQR